MRSIRFPGEGDDAFRVRAERAARCAKALIDGALANACIQNFIADPELTMWTEQAQRRNPTVRIDYEQATCIAGIGEGLHATRNKHWGDGPQILPLQTTDPVDPMYILYVYKENSVYNRRFEQRKRMKELLGRRYRHLVEKAKYHRHTQTMFLEALTDEEHNAIERRIGVDAREFWVRGTRQAHAGAATSHRAA